MGRTNTLVFSYEDEIYQKNGLGFSSLTHLDEIGLINFDVLSGFRRIFDSKRVIITYFQRKVLLEFVSEIKNSLEVGTVLLSKTGSELSTICGVDPVDGFFEYTVEKIKLQKGVTLSVDF